MSLHEFVKRQKPNGEEDETEDSKSINVNEPSSTQMESQSITKESNISKELQTVKNPDNAEKQEKSAKAENINTGKEESPTKENPNTEKEEVTINKEKADATPNGMEEKPKEGKEKSLNTEKIYNNDKDKSESVVKPAKEIKVDIIKTGKEKSSTTDTVKIKLEKDMSRKAVKHTKPGTETPGDKIHHQKEPEQIQKAKIRKIETSKSDTLPGVEEITNKFLAWKNINDQPETPPDSKDTNDLLEETENLIKICNEPNPCMQYQYIGQSIKRTEHSEQPSESQVNINASNPQTVINDPDIKMDERSGPKAEVNIIKVPKGTESNTDHRAASLLKADITIIREMSDPNNDARTDVDSSTGNDISTNTDQLGSQIEAHNTNTEIQTVESTVREQTETSVECNNDQLVPMESLSTTDNQRGLQIKPGISDRRVIREKIRLKASIIDNQLVIIKCEKKPETQAGTRPKPASTESQPKMKRVAVDQHSHRETDSVTHDHVVADRASSTEVLPGIRVKTNMTTAQPAETIVTTDSQTPREETHNNAETQSADIQNITNDDEQFGNENIAPRSDLIIFRTPFTTSSQLSIPSSSRTSNATIRFERRMNRPACWSDKQLQYFKNENYWLRVKHGKLGCDVCIQVGRLNVRRRMGVSVSPEWTTYSITHYGTSLLQQQRSLRKKVFEHRKSMAHKMCEHILEHCRLSYRIKRNAIASQTQRSMSGAPEQGHIPMIQQSIDTRPSAPATSTQTVATDPNALQGANAPIKLEEASSDDEPSMVSSMSICRIKWESSANQRQNQLIQLTAPTRDSSGVYTSYELLRGPDQQDQLSTEQNQSVHEAMNLETCDEINRSEQHGQARNSNQTTQSVQTQSGQNIHDPTSDQLASVSNLPAQSTQISTRIMEQQSTSVHNLTDTSDSEDILQNWELTDIPIMSFPTTVSSPEEQDLVKIFRIIYQLIKLNRSFLDLPTDIELQKLNGCTFHKKLDISATDVCSLISSMMKNRVSKNLVQSGYRFSIILEEFKFLSAMPTLIIYLRIIIIDNDKPIDVFLDVIELPNNEAEGIYSSVVSCLESYYIDETFLQTKLLSVCVDGASPILGINSKFPNLLYEKFPKVIMWYCSLHRLEHSVGDTIEKISGANYFQLFIEKLYNVCMSSPKNKKQLMGSAKDLEQQISKIGGVFTSKLVASSFETIKAIWNSYASLYNYFSEASKDISRNSAERSIYNELRLQLSSVGFVKNLGMMYDALQELNELSVELQQQQSLVDAHLSICRQIKIFECMIRKPGPMTKKSLAAEGTETFFNVPLQKIEESGLEINREKFFEELAKNLKSRLLSTKPSQLTTERNNFQPLIAELKVLDRKFWPEEFSITYGEEELTSLCERLGVETRPFIRSFREFKEIGGRIPNLNLQKLNNIINIVPVSTIECQRLFHKIDLIIKAQNITSVKMISAILFIQLYGPPLKKFSPLWYVRNWEQLQDEIPEERNPDEVKENQPSLTEKTLWKIF